MLTELLWDHIFMSDVTGFRKIQVSDCTGSTVYDKNAYAQYILLLFYFLVEYILSFEGLSSREIIVYSTVSTVFVIIILISVSIFFYRHRRKLPPAKCISTVADDYDIINDDNRLSRIVQNSPSGEYLNPEYIDPCHTWTTTM